MLLRAARRKAQCETIRNTKFSANLRPSWLCPTQLRFQDEQRRLNASDARPRPTGLHPKRDGHDATSTTPRRSMATAVENYGMADDIPFEGLHSDIYGQQKLTTLRPFNPSMTLMISDSLATAPSKHRISQGVGGEQRDMVAVMRACLQIGRLQRAGAILHRLGVLKINKEDLLDYHNEYLEIAVYNLVANPSEAASLALHKWFEMELNKFVEPNADTVALMLKASMQSPPGNRRERLVRRYIGSVSESVGLEALQVGGPLSDDELAHITQIATDFNVQQDKAGQENLALMNEISHAAPIADAQPLPSYDAPEVMPADQKGYGLKALKKALSLFSTDEETPSGHSEYEARRERQCRLEEDSIVSAIDRWRLESVNLSKMGMNSALQNKNIGARMWTWQLAMVDRLKEELARVEKSELREKKTSRDSDRCIYGPFLRYIPVEKLSAVTILATMSALTSMGIEKGITLSSAIMTIGQSIEDESVAEALRRLTKKGSVGSMSQKSRKRRVDDMLRKIQREKAKPTGNPLAALRDNRDPWEPQWSANLRAKVGAILLECLVESATVPVVHTNPDTHEIISQMQPALSHSHQYKLGKKVGVVMANPVLVKQLLQEPVHSLLVKHLPMIVEPDPWSHFSKGGFLSTPARVMRIKLGDTDQRNYAEAAIARGDLNQLLKGLDVLGKTPWKVNQPVFNTMLKAWNTGDAIANLAPSNPFFEYPPEPSKTKDPVAHRNWMMEIKQIENTKSGLHSQRCFQNFQLEIARALRNEIFYFPHNVDFRGRAYPIPPYLNHMGADHCRGVLMFGEGKPLGDQGLKWLKIHLSNVFGYDKASLKEREEFAMQHLPEIQDSVADPLGGKRWWLEAEDPWQTLAACFEIKSALDSPDPTAYVSHLPVHQDGTCNGLQHYAALGGDEWGAKQVNLIPGDRPADVYTAVADLVKESIAEDLKRGSPHAEVLTGKITRKIVKQTVMTNVYGVTYVGAKAQVLKQLTAAYPDLPKTDTVNAQGLAAYIATKIFQALSTMFRGAHDIQYWLGECAGRISVAFTPEQIIRYENDLKKLHNEDELKSTKTTKKDLLSAIEQNLQFKSGVIWTTPLHMPVVQPYRVSQSKTVETNMQHISLSEPHSSDPVSRRKQLQGFPPNFVHSLDATHMLLSALKSDEIGLSFAAVHDSFWTHAADTDKMNEVLRDAFIRIHSEDVIGRLAAEFEIRYHGCYYKKVFKYGSEMSLRIVELRRSKKFRELLAKHVPYSLVEKSPLHTVELLLERKRHQLLQSSDPIEVEEGRAMVTPGSLCEELDEADLDSSEEDVSGIALGEMTEKEANDDGSLGINVPKRAVEDEENGLETVRNLSAEEKEARYEEVERRVKAAMGPNGTNRFANHMNGKVRKKTAGQHQHAWVPLKFPPVPKKGTFNVERLKESSYFFS